jgi:PIN domain nuclease of toxin-antitoxin system
LLKVQIGKLQLPRSAGAYLVSQMSANGVSVLPLKLEHALRAEDLPLHHRDPFDRMLIAQSIEEDWPIITADPVFQRYPVQVIW